MNENSHIPPEIERAINKHTEQNLPNYLKSYTGANKSGYVPRSVEASISQNLQQGLPEHLKPYADSYVSQNVTHTFNNSALPGSLATRPNSFGSRPPIPNELNRSHAMPTGEQHSVELNSLPIAAQTRFEDESGRAYIPSNLTQDPNQTQQTEQGEYHQNYEFIMNSDKSQKKPAGLPSLPGFSPKLSRVLAVVGGFILLLIIYGIIKGIANGPSNYPALLSVLQDQVELSHIATNASVEPDISVSNQTFVATISLVVGNSTSNLSTYLKTNGHKTTLKEEDLKVNTTVDQNIASAESTGDFNSVFSQEASDQLKTYISDLSNAYNVTKGPKGRALLTSDYKQAVLLKKVLDSNSAGTT